MRLLVRQDIERNSERDFIGFAELQRGTPVGAKVVILHCKAKARTPRLAGWPPLRAGTNPG